MSQNPANGASPGGRIASLDQFRGYTVLGMLFVNFLGGYKAVHPVFQHHNTYCSYADTIMPQFFFAVGFAFRLVVLRRLASIGTRATYGHAARRSLGLILLGLVLYHLDGKYQTWPDLTRAVETRGLPLFLASSFGRDPFQTLVHIGVTSLWVLPVIAASGRVRLAFLVASAALHVILSDRFYLDFAWKRPVIDGGPLGFLTWTIPTLLGAHAYDLWTELGPRRACARMLGESLLWMAAGYALSCLGGFSLAAPPFTPPIDRNPAPTVWLMSQRTGGVSYLAFSAGFSLAVYALFVLAADLGGLGLGIFRTLGSNALAAYVLHSLVNGAVKPFVPKDAPPWYIMAGVSLAIGLTYGFVRHLERHRIFIRM